MDFKEEIMINPEILDMEWLDQPKLILKYSEMLATARVRYEKSKEKMDVYEAELALSIRSAPKDYGIDKITEQVIKYTIAADEERSVLYKEVIQKKYNVDMLQSAVNAFEHRKKALENLVTLHGQQYFAGPSVPRNLAEEYKARIAKANFRIPEKTKNRKRRRDA